MTSRGYDGPQGPSPVLDAIARAARRADLDENAGDWMERAETILWLATDGAEGKDWGSAYEDDDPGT